MHTERDGGVHKHTRIEECTKRTQCAHTRTLPFIKSRNFWIFSCFSGRGVAFRRNFSHSSCKHSRVQEPRGGVCV